MKSSTLPPFGVSVSPAWLALPPSPLLGLEQGVLLILSLEVFLSWWCRGPLAFEPHLPGTWQEWRTSCKQGLSQAVLS